MSIAARFLLSALLLAATTSRAAAEDDRYADWPTAEVPETPETPETESRAPRTLPVRFERRAAEDDSYVRQASANMEVDKPRELKPQSASTAKGQSSAARIRPEMPPIATLVGSLGVVAGLFMIVAWTMRRGMPRRPAILPHDVLEVLGRQRLTPKQEVQLVRVGNKLLLLSIAANAVEPLSEVTDAEEVDRLAELCYQAWSHRTGPRIARAAARRQDKLDLTGFNNTQRPAKSRGEFNG